MTDSDLWDALLIVAVSAQVLIASLAYDPKWKAWMIALPLPFTVAYLAVGQPVDAANVLAMLLLFVFAQAVRMLHIGMKVPIVLSIALSVGVYSLLGLWINRVVPRDDMTFWICASLVFLLAAGLLRVMPAREEPGHRTELPVWIKLIVVLALVTLVVSLKHNLGGIVTFFPMVSTFVAYEARKSLWTIGRQIPVLILTMTPMIVVMHLCEPALGPVRAVALGWAAFAAVLFVKRVSRLWFAGRNASWIARL